MKQVTLNIPENEFQFFMKLIKSLSFVKVEKTTSIEDKLSTEQKEIWDNIKNGFKQLDQLEKGKLKSRSIESLFEEVSQ